MTVNNPPRVYVETSVWNFQFADDSPEFQAITQEFFREAAQGLFDLYSSSIVLGELLRAPEPRRTQLVQFHDQHAPTLLETTDQVISLSKEYLARQLIPQKYENDALHVAIATVAQLDFLVSWNMKHIVKDKTRDKVNAANLLAGYPELKIRVPGEITEDVD